MFNRGGKGSQFPGRRITAGDTKKSRKYHKYFLQYSTLLPKHLGFEHGGTKVASYHGRHLTSLHPATRDENSQPSRQFSPRAASAWSITTSKRRWSSNFYL